ncbi:MAG: cation transporter [Deltaproteobacteria bacterium]|nr:cation transporter [Deltaproteobacteria bacterium]
MTHHHSEHCSHGPISTARLFFTIALNFVITVAEVIGGVLSGSLSLISDALHNFSDGVAIIISYLAMRLGERSNTESYTFGLKRAEIMAAVINASVLMAICFYLGKEAFSRFTHPEPIAGGLMMVVAGIGLVANLICTRLLHQGSKESINIRSAYLHLLSDAISSLAVIIGGGAIYFFQIYWLDPLLTIVISLYVLKGSFGIVKEATWVLMMAAPKFISLGHIREEIEAIPGVKNIHHAHLWMLNEQSIHFETHVDVEDMLISESCRLSAMIEEKLSCHRINHVTLQFECDVCTTKNLV